MLNEKSYRLNLNELDSIRIDVEEHDTCTIELVSANLDGAQLTVQKGNKPDGNGYALSTPTILSATGVHDISSTDFDRYRYLFIFVSTPASSNVSADLYVTMKKLGA